MSGKSQDYPDKTFMIGVGEGKALESAKDTARAELKRIFEAGIDRSEKGTQKEDGKGSKPENTNQGLAGVTIADTWFDESHGVFYALALIDRRKIYNEFSGKALMEEEAIKNGLDTAENALDPVEKLRAYSKAIAAYDKKALLIARMHIVDPAAVQEIPTGLSRAEISESIADTAKRIGFSIQDESTKNRGLKEVAAAVLTKSGFRVDVNTGASFVVVKCSLELKAAQRAIPNAKFVNWTGKIELLSNGSEKKVLSSINPLGQVSGANEDLAEQKAVMVSSEVLRSDFDKMIKQYFFGQN